jgi:hypothetical protein
MRASSLRAAEILTWCNDSCELGPNALRVFLAVFVIGWFPWPATVILVGAVLFDRTIPGDTGVHLFGEKTGE